MKTYNVRIDILLEPVGTPDITVTCNGQTYDCVLLNPTWFNFNYNGHAGTERLTVEHKNRKPSDGVTAVIVKNVKFNDIDHASHVYQGLYYPNNMDQRQTNYIDWNGIWVLDYTVPVYTWMHNTQGLGWIYD